jgi:glycosyltransferase involved in cell wall biosynthesis
MYSALGNSPKKICMLAYTAYEYDNRVRRYAEALAKRGDKVDVIALATGNAPLGVDRISGVTLYRIQRRDSVEKHKWSYVWRLLRFLLVSSFFLSRRHYRIRYDLIHVHNVPDFLVFAAWYPKLTGAKLILDIHDIVPEFFLSKFGVTESHLYFKLLKQLEKASAKFADHVIVSNHLWRDKLISRSVAEEKCSVFLNHVDPAIFYRRTRTRCDGTLIILFPGTFQSHQGLDIAIEALASLKDRVPNAELHLYGGGGVEADLRKQVARLGLNGKVKFCGGVSLDQIADVMANADLGIVPKRANSFGNEAYSTKIMEFMSQGIPVVASRTKIDTFYFDETVVHFFTPGDAKAMAKAMLEVIENEALRKALAKKGYEYADRHNWERRKAEYFELVDSLLTNGVGASSPTIGSNTTAGPPVRV